VLTSILQVIVVAAKNARKTLPPAEDLFELDDLVYKSSKRNKLARTARLRLVIPRLHAQCAVDPFLRMSSLKLGYIIHKNLKVRNLISYLAHFFECADFWKRQL
jgi:hypothetical protein